MQTNEKWYLYRDFVKKLEQNDYDTKEVARLLHAVMGIVTEAGELMDVMKKHLVYHRELDKQKLIDELGDLLFYFTMATDYCGSNIREVMEANVAKLSARYPKGFDSEKANNRNLDAEQKAIEGTLENKI